MCTFSPIVWHQDPKKANKCSENLAIQCSRHFYVVFMLFTLFGISNCFVFVFSSFFVFMFVVDVVDFPLLFLEMFICHFSYLEIAVWQRFHTSHPSFSAYPCFFFPRCNIILWSCWFLGTLSISSSNIRYSFLSYKKNVWKRIKCKCKIRLGRDR